MRQHRHTTPLLAGLYPILEGEASRTFKPRSLHTSSDYVPSQAPEAAVEHSPVPTGMVGMAAVGAVGLAGILFLAMGFLLLRSIGIGMLRAPVVPDVLVAVAALLPPIGATCITIGGDLGQLSVGWYICGMLSAASYAFFVFLRMLHVHFLALSVRAHAGLWFQFISCFGAGWIFQTLGQARQRRRPSVPARPQVACFRCHQRFMPPEGATLVGCPYCGLVNRVPWDP